MIDRNKLTQAIFCVRKPFALAIPAVILCGVSLVQAAPLPSPAGARHWVSNSTYLLGPDDVLQIVVSNHPDLNATVTVRPDGRITLPRAGEVVARGKSPSALGLEIQKRLSRTLNNARVLVSVGQARARQARIIGAVTSPGTYPVKPDGHLIDLIALAGGLNTKPARVSGRLIRSGAVVNLDVARAVANPIGPANLPVRPDDLVVLDARNFERQITVTGSVLKPGLYDLDEDLTVTSLLAQAGGATPTASLRKAHVLRNGKPVLTDLRDATAGNLTQDSPLNRFVFQPGDVLDVPENQTRYGVMGQVVRPSYYPLPETPGGLTLLKALSSAGGALVDGDLSEAVVTRIVNGQPQNIPVNAEAMFNGDVSDNFILQNDDVLLIPKKDKQVSVIGQVTRPGAYPLDKDMTLLDLLAEAGNPVRGAGLSRAYVLRNGVQMPVNLRAAVIDHRIDEAIGTFKLQRDDVLVVPDVSDQVQVSGQVARPGSYSLDDDLTISSLLTKAGSPSNSAALRQAYVLRGDQKIPFDLRPTVVGDVDPVASKFRFEPGDNLVVPANQLQVSIMGLVSHPGTFPYPENPEDATLLNVLSFAGGPSNEANLKKASIIRKANGQSQLIEVDMSGFLKRGDMKNNVQLKPDDIVYLPPKKHGFKISDLFGPLTLIRAVGGGF